MKLLNKYVNGNYDVFLFDDGTKVRTLHKGQTEFKPKRPESIDLCISHKCSIGCPYCYNDCNSNGQIADFENYKVKRFLQTLEPGTEIAVGGGALSEIPIGTLHGFLDELRFGGCIVNITLNIKELLAIKKKDGILAAETFIQALSIIKGVHGIGISYNSSDEAKEILLRVSKLVPNIVIHTIAGVQNEDDYRWLAEHHFKVLVLGFKYKGRGLNYNFKNNITDNLKWAKENILSLRKQFKTLSFDCLAVEQLDIQSQVDEETWKSNYMGDDGKFTMYVDLVNCMFAKSSTEDEMNFNHFSFQAYDANSMFNYIRKNN